MKRRRPGRVRRLGRESPRRGQQGSGGDHERAVRAGERVAEHLDRTAVGGGGALEVAAEGEFVLEGEVDHAVGPGGLFSQRIEVVEAACLYSQPWPLWGAVLLATRTL